MAYFGGMLRRFVSAGKTELVAAVKPIHHVDFGDFRLKIDRRDYGGRMYLMPHYAAHLSCPFERDIVEIYRPGVFLDVGANYGFIALAHHVVNPRAKIIAIEPSPLLLPFLEENLRNNGVTNRLIVPAMCTSQVSGKSDFAINPTSSQDNRVLGAKHWQTVRVSTVTIDQVLEGHGDSDFVMIKIDTQGHEAGVIAGAERFLTTRKKWAIRMEFAPKWLVSQGTDPIAFFAQLTERFRVAEIPQRARFSGDDVQNVLASTLTSDAAADFVLHVTTRAGGDGWCDLLIVP